MLTYSIRRRGAVAWRVGIPSAAEALREYVYAQRVAPGHRIYAVYPSAEKDITEDVVNGEYRDGTTVSRALRVLEVVEEFVPLYKGEVRLHPETGNPGRYTSYAEYDEVMGDLNEQIARAVIEAARE